MITMSFEKRKQVIGRHYVANGRPARYHRDSLVTGNGRHKLHALGNPSDETVMLSQEDLYNPRWKDTPTAPDCARALDRVRELLLEGKYEEASFLSLYESLANGVSDKHHPAQRHFGMLVKLSQRVGADAGEYLRYMNLRNAVTTVQWEDASGVWRREALVPRGEHDLALLRISPPDGAELDIRISLLAGGDGAPDVSADMDGGTPRPAWAAGYMRDPSLVDKTARSDPPIQPPRVTAVVRDRAILVTGHYNPALERGGFASALLVEGGEAARDGEGIRIRGKGPVLLKMKAAPCPEGPCGAAEKLLEELMAAPGDFDAYAAENARAHGAMFDRLELDLGSDPDDHYLTAEELMQKQRLAQGIHPVLMEKLVDVGRYFLLYESGKWPPIYGHVNTNINHQVSSANIAALPEMMDVFMRWIEWQLPDARENARLVFGARGFLIACHPDTESGKLYHFAHEYPHHYWISGSGWCLQPFLEHYYCTGDETFLRERMLPLYAELAEFYEDYLVLRDENGKWIFAPSYSPENWPLNTRVQTALNATMDITVCREVLETLLNLGPDAGIGTTEQREKWKDMLEALPPYLYGEHGELKEWAWESLQERFDHRHLSHLYGVYPGDEIRPDADPAAYRGAFIANRMRAQENSSVHGIAHRAQIAARLRDPYLVYQNVKQLIETGFVNEALSMRHNPYRLHFMPDGQGALPTIVLESLLYSRPGVIEPLPALLWCWPKGKLTGMMSRTAARVEELSWDMDAGCICLRLTPLKTQEIAFAYAPGYEKLSVSGAKTREEAGRIILELTEGEEADIRIEGARRGAGIY